MAQDSTWTRKYRDMTLCYLAHPLAIVLTHGKKLHDFAGGNVVDPFQDAVPCWQAVYTSGPWANRPPSN